MNSDNTQPNPWQMLVSFFIDTPGYTDRDREMFVCGAEYAMIHRSIQKDGKFVGLIHNENSSRLRMLAKVMNARLDVKRIDDTWSEVDISRN